MLTIRPEQSRHLEERLVDDVAARLWPVLAVRYPETAADAADARRRIARCSREAWRLGLRSESAIGDFVDLCLQLGDDFPRHPAVLEVLSDPRIAPDARPLALARRLRPVDWDDVRAWAAANTGPAP